MTQVSVDSAALAEVVDTLTQVEQAMTLLTAQLKMLVTGPSVGQPVFTVATIATPPAITGLPVTDTTIAITPAAWNSTSVITQIERQWQEAPSPSGPWTDIVGATANDYIVDALNEGNVLRVGERARNGGGLSAWSYSAATAVVAAPATPYPVIDQAGYIAPSIGLAVGSVVTINAAQVTDATTVQYRMRRDGVTSTALTPVGSYTLISSDVCGQLELVTEATNAFGTVTATTNAGPVSQLPVAQNLIDLGSAQATEDYILAGFASKWVESGTPTKTATVYNVDEFLTLWTSIKNGAVTERWDVELDWDGISIHTSGLGLELGLALKPNSAKNTLHFDNGGWIRFKNAAGRKPAIGNRVVCSNHRGVVWDGIDFAGVSTTGALLKTKAGLYVSGNSTYVSDPIIIVRNCRIGKSAVTGVTEPSTTYVAGIYVNGCIPEQMQISNTLINGVWFGIKAACRNLWITNTHTMNHCEDNIKLFGHTIQTGYYAFVHLDRCTAGLRNIEYLYRKGHCDFAQTGNGKEKHLGYRCLYTDCLNSNDHKFAGGGSQGFYNDDYFQTDNLFCVRRCLSLASAPNGFAMFSPNARYVSYIERCTFARTGMVPSLFSPDTTGATDFNPGISNPVAAGAPGLAGIAFKAIDCIAGAYAARTWTFYSGCITVNHAVSQTGNTPEMVFEGRDFQRGGPSVNNLPGKFGYTLPNEATQAGLVSDLIANFTPKAAFAGKGAPPPNPANYTAPVAG